MLNPVRRITLPRALTSALHTNFFLQFSSLTPISFKAISVMFNLELMVLLHYAIYWIGGLLTVATGLIL